MMPTDARAGLLPRYSSQLGHLMERRLAETALVAARQEAERQAECARQAMRQTQFAYTALRQEMECRAETQHKFEYLATHDLLTGLPNRSLFFERLNRALYQAERNHHRVAFMYLDLDHFKDVNDTLGHAVGDELLKEVATRLTLCLREEDTVARFGGDEFAIVQSGLSDADGARLLAQRLLSALADPIEVAGKQIFTSASIGITLYPDDGTEPAALQRNADLAMYHAKQEQRNAFHFFDIALNDKVHRRTFLEGALREAVARNQMWLAYQPQVRLTDGAIIGVEALLRWTHPQCGALTPDEFIPVAESCGLINDIGSWVLQESCRQAVRWDAAGLPPLTMGVNVAVNQLKTGDLPQEVADILSATGLHPGRLELEITETGIMRDLRDMAHGLTSLRELGVRLAIDDFGTGYSSLSYLRSLPVDRIKIDRSFVCDVAHNPDAAAITTTIVRLADSLGLDVIAEGVETLAHAEFLRDVGCPWAQGFYYGRPVPAAQLASLFTSSSLEAAHE